MASPAHDLVIPSLLLAGVFFLIAALVLSRYRLTIRQLRNDLEQDLIDQMAQPADRVSQPEASSQAGAQSFNGGVGSVMTHTHECAGPRPLALAGTEAKGAQTL